MFRPEPHVASDWMSAPAAQVEVLVDADAASNAFRGNISVARSPWTDTVRTAAERLPLPAVDSPLLLDRGFGTCNGLPYFERTFRFIEPRRAQLVQQVQRIACVGDELIVVSFTQLAKHHTQGHGEFERVFSEAVAPRV